MGDNGDKWYHYNVQLCLTELLIELHLYLYIKIQTLY